MTTDSIPGDPKLSAFYTARYVQNQAQDIATRAMFIGELCRQSDRLQYKPEALENMADVLVEDAQSTRELAEKLRTAIHQITKGGA